MQAIILAGGFGTRLKSMVSNVPKPMALIRGVPFLTILLEKLNNFDFKKIVIAVGYKGEIIENYYGFKYKNLILEYSYDDIPLGTGGSTKKALRLIDDDFVFVINGDTYFDVNYDEIRNSKKNTIVCKYINDSSRYGRILIDKKNMIKGFLEKKDVSHGYINGGIYYINSNIFDKYNFSGNFSLEKDLFEKKFNVLNIKAHISESYFIDIGIPSDFERAQNELFF